MIWPDFCSALIVGRLAPLGLHNTRFRSVPGAGRVAQGPVQTLRVPPRDPPERRQFQVPQILEGLASPDELGLVRAVGALGHGVVVDQVADRAGRGKHAEFPDPGGAHEADVLRAMVCNTAFTSEKASANERPHHPLQRRRCISRSTIRARTTPHPTAKKQQRTPPSHTRVPYMGGSQPCHRPRHLKPKHLRPSARRCRQHRGNHGQIHGSPTAKASPQGGMAHGHRIISARSATPSNGFSMGIWNSKAGPADVNSGLPCCSSYRSRHIVLHSCHRNTVGHGRCDTGHRHFLQKAA